MARMEGKKRTACKCAKSWSIEWRSNDIAAIFRYFSTVFLTEWFISLFLPFYFFSFFFLFFFIVADCLARVGQAIIRTFVSRYRKWVHGFTHALPLNNNYYYYEPGYQSYGYRDPLLQITGTRWHVQWERGEFEKREENKRHRISLSSLDVNAYEETIMPRRNYMLEVSFALLWKNRYYVNWTARKIGNPTDCVSFPVGRMIFPNELTFSQNVHTWYLKADIRVSHLRLIFLNNITENMVVYER